MEIKNKIQHDSVVDLPMVDAYMTWALKAAEEVVGKQGLSIILRENGLERFTDHYPPENLLLSKEITSGDYANLCTGVMKFYGRAGKSVVIRIGRISSKFATEKQGAVFNVTAMTALKFLPPSPQIKMVLENIQGGFRKIYKDSGSEIHAGVGLVHSKNPYGGLRAKSLMWRKWNAGPWAHPRVFGRSVKQQRIDLESYTQQT